MAGERKGITYEAILYVVLERLRKKGKLKGTVFWNETPDGMTIEPDLVVGPDKDHPTSLFLVTHSGSAGDSHKKFWRNLGELFEAKTQLATVPRVYNVAFDSVIKESLKKVQEAAFDGQLIAGDESYGKSLQAWVDANNKSLPKERFEKAEAVKKAAGSKGLSALTTKLEAHVTTLIGSINASMKSVWALERKRPKGKAPTARETFVRRGLSKFSLFPNIDVAARLYKRERVDSGDVPDFSFLLGLTRKSIGRVVLADREVLNGVSVFEKGLGSIDLANGTRELVRNSSAGFRTQQEKVRSIGRLSAFERYVSQNYGALTTPGGMQQHLQQLHDTPTSGLQLDQGVSPPTGVWLFDYVGAVVKAKEGKAQAFGYSTFAKHPAAANSQVGSMDVGTWASCFMNQYFSRKTGFIAPAAAITHCARVLAENLQAVSLGQLATLSTKIQEAYVAKEYEATLLAHRGIDPVLELIRHAVPSANVERVRTCFAESAELGGQSGKTQVARINNTLINWQSASDAGRDHKKKELCGRAVGLRYSWDAKTKTFLKRPGVDKLILVVDGTWRQSDLDALIRAGWDEIFYPDEMDKLAAAIV